MIEKGLLAQRLSRAAVVLLAYGMGKKAFNRWKEVEDKLDKISKEILGLERHRILLARFERHKLKDRTVRCPGVRDIPWLITDRTNLATTLDEYEFNGLLHLLLDVLVFTERSGPRIHSKDRLNLFFDSGVSQSREAHEKVRLLASPGTDLRDHLEKIAERLAREVLQRSSLSLSCDSREKDEAKEKFWRQIQFVLNGEIPYWQFYKALWDECGLGRWGVADLLRDAPGFLGKLAERIESTLDLPSPESTKLSWLQKLVKTVLERAGLRRRTGPKLSPKLREELCIL
ncbi:MAG: hypothetical protein FGF53_09020, partial [Candidatus Brockarchaeota archaeon]|nr:hypothetical protein [Candidatus Brockarchaeota archaeon]